MAGDPIADLAECFPNGPQFARIDDGPVMTSIYRSRPKRPVDDDDVRQPLTVSGSPAAPPSRSERQDLKRDWTNARRTKPAGYMLPVSLKWFASLPLDVRPMALVTDYARIANLLALQWDKPTACRAYLDDLINDRRGNRKGFPPEVRRDLLTLRDYYYNGHISVGE
jgi:hypothetical protein